MTIGAELIEYCFFSVQCVWTATVENIADWGIRNVLPQSNARKKSGIDWLEFYIPLLSFISYIFSLFTCFCFLFLSGCVRLTSSLPAL